MPESSPLGQPTRRFTIEDLNDPKVVRVIRATLGVSQRALAHSMGVREATPYLWERDGMEKVHASTKKYLLLKFDLQLLNKKHNL